MKKFLLLFLFQIVSNLALAQFIELNQVDLSKFPAPPQDGTMEQKKDLEIVIERQAKATDADCTRAEKGSKLSAKNFIDEGLLTTEEARVLEPLFKEIHKQGNVFVKNLKKKWKRVRPYRNSKSVQKKCGDHRSQDSYPSGHSTIGYLSARVFGLVIPEKAEALLARGKSIGDDRVLSGVHYLRDVEAGRNLADQIFAVLEKNPKFQARIQHFNAEMKKLHP